MGCERREEHRKGEKEVRRRNSGESMMVQGQKKKKTLVIQRNSGNVLETVLASIMVPHFLIGRN